MRSLTRGRVARLVVPAALASLLLSACSDEPPGTAAAVGSKRITVEEVQERTQLFLDSYPEATGSGVTAAQVSAAQVENFIRAAIVDSAAARAGVSVTPTEIDAFIADFGGMETLMQRTSGQGVPPVPELARAEVRSFLLQQALGVAAAGPNATQDDLDIATRDATDAESARVDVEVNPRFGTWDGSLVNAGNGSISIPVADLDGSQGTEDPAVVPQG